MVAFKENNLLENLDSVVGNYETIVNICIIFTGGLEQSSITCTRSPSKIETFETLFDTNILTIDLFVTVIFYDYRTNQMNP